MPKDSLGRERRPEQDAALEAINRQRRREGWRPTKPLRFYLPDALADRLEAMSKRERDVFMAEALRNEMTEEEPCQY